MASAISSSFSSGDGESTQYAGNHGAGESDFTAGATFAGKGGGISGPTSGAVVVPSTSIIFA